MKKRVLSIAIASMMVASTANAAKIYEKGDVSWDLKADVQVQIRQKSGQNEDSFVDYDDAELKNRFTYKLGGNTKAFAQVDYDFEKEKSEETYVGMDFGGYGFLLGKTDLPSDDFGHEKAWEGSSFEDAFNEVAEDSDNQIQLHAEFAGLELKVATDVEDAEVDENGESIQSKVLFDAFLYGEFGNFDFGVAYQDVETDPNADSIDTFGVGVGAKFGPVSVGVDYSDNDIVEVLHLSTSVKVAPKTKLAIGYELAEEKGVDINSWYVNTTYKIHKKVSLLAEVSNTDEDDSDAGYVLGMRVKL